MVVSTCACLPKGREGGEKVVHAINPGVLELADDHFSVGCCSDGDKRGADRLGLFGEGLGPGGFGGWLCGKGGVGRVARGEDGLSGGAGGVLELGTQPADRAGASQDLWLS